jgi:hypothetical protein
MSAATLLAAAVGTACDVDISIAHRPTRLSGRTAYVEPADPWKEPAETFGAVSVGLVVVLVAGSTDPNESIEWLDVQSSALMGVDPVSVGTDEVEATSAGAPIILVDEGGGTFFACRVEFSRFITGE